MEEEYSKQPRVSPVSTCLVISMLKIQGENEGRRKEVKCPKVRFRISEKTFNERYEGSCLRFEGPLQSESMWNAIRRRSGEKADFPNDCFYAIYHNNESFSVTGKNLIGS